MTKFYLYISEAKVEMLRCTAIGIRGEATQRRR
jgi:hypothetical protein